MSFSIGMEIELGGQGRALTLKPPFDKALTQRIDIIAGDDSNQLLSGHGWDDGFQYSMSQMALMYASGLISQNENDGNGSGTGLLVGRAGSLIGATTGAPADLHKYLDRGGGNLFPARYAWVADGSSVGSNTTIGLVIQADCPIDNGGPLEFYLWWGSAASGSGSFRPFVRIGQSPFSTLADPGAINTNTGVISLNLLTVSILADAARKSIPIEFKPLRTGVQGIVGPFFETYMRVSNPARSVGFSYHTLDYQGGKSSRGMALDVQQASMDTLTHFIGEARRLQGANKIIVPIIGFGLNDRLETLTSLGPGAVTDGDSPEAYADNLLAIYQRYLAVYSANSWNSAELWPVLKPPHPVSVPNDAELVTYIQAAKDLSATIPQSRVIDFPSMITFDQMVARGWINNGGADPPHLTQAGYRGMAMMAITS